ncbi:hypothetical protein WN51_06736 [Melipona quadrifasciata]|uniref:Uncharacterized protein n=1 Tax=Melipona quadrifasciata TaxID=166423 RepID=A0A0M8ZQE1_9HYME|nr:hypothetical protein WN51_06736 [Melipona quadrifasciata]
MSLLNNFNHRKTSYVPKRNQQRREHSAEYSPQESSNISHRVSELWITVGKIVGASLTLKSPRIPKSSGLPGKKSRFLRLFGILEYLVIFIKGDIQSKINYMDIEFEQQRLYMPDTHFGEQKLILLAKAKNWKIELSCCFSQNLQVTTEKILKIIKKYKTSAKKCPFAA